MSLEERFNQLALRGKPTIAVSYDGDLVVTRSWTLARTKRRRSLDNEFFVPLPGDDTPSGFADVRVSYDKYTGFQTSPVGDADTAYADAVANAALFEQIRGFALVDINGSSGDGEADLTKTLLSFRKYYNSDGTTQPQWTAAAEKNQRWLNIATSTGYLKIYWNQVTRTVYNTGTEDDPPPVETIEAETLVYSGAPVGTRGSVSTYHDTDKITISFEDARPVTPLASGDTAGSSKEILLRNFRWSAVPSYTPPEDGSANGFPP